MRTGATLPHYVYRCYDAANRLLYVGCTMDVEQRMSVHASTWSNPVSAALTARMTRYEVEEHPDKESGRKAERAAIYAEAPLFNLHHQRDRVPYAVRRARIDAYVAETAPPPNLALIAALGEIADAYAANLRGGAA